MPGVIQWRPEIEPGITAAIYARVSTVDQNNEMQLTGLRSYPARIR